MSRRGTAFWNVVLVDEFSDLDEIQITGRRPEAREAFARQLAAVTETPVWVAASAGEAFEPAWRSCAGAEEQDAGTMVRYRRLCRR